MVSFIVDVLQRKWAAPVTARGFRPALAAGPRFAFGLLGRRAVESRFARGRIEPSAFEHASLPKHEEG